MRNTCPVCGFQMEDPPADHNICPSCGTEFGYHTAGRSHDDLRTVWLRSGARWWSPVDRQPANWNPYMQLIQSGMMVFMHEGETAASSKTVAHVQAKESIRFSINGRETTTTSLLTAAA